MSLSLSLSPPFFNPNGYLSNKSPLSYTMSSEKDLVVFLLMGQSNMSGRGDLSASPLPHPEVFSWQKDSVQWKVATEPLCEDHPKAAAGLAPLFAEHFLLSSSSSSSVGFIPTAIGGSPLSSWEPDGEHYKTTLKNLHSALSEAPSQFRSVRVGGVLFHQGETDALDETLSGTYADRLKGVVDRLRSDLEAPELPFVAGELGAFCKAEYTATVNAAMHSVAEVVPKMCVVRVEGLVDKGDNLHFDTNSLHALGKRYFEAYNKLVA